MEKEAAGVMIILREIYDSVQFVGDSLQGMDEKLRLLEGKSSLSVTAIERI